MNPLESRLRSYGQVLDQAAEDHEPAAASTPGPGRRRVLVAVGTAAAVTVAALGVITVVGGDNSGYRVQAYGAGGADLTRGRDGSFPYLLIDGWQVTRADDQDRPLDSRDPDGARYHSAEATFTRRDSQVTLHLYGGDTSVRDGYVEDRADAGTQRQTTVLGYPATITLYRGGIQTSAIWFADQVTYELVLETGDRDDYFDALDALRVVDEVTWEAAMPDRAITPRQRGAVVDRMLVDIPLPPGFDVAPLRQGEAAIDRTQLGVKVAGSVACAWIDRWLQARKDGNEAAGRDATRALGTSRNWQVFKDMQAVPKSTEDWNDRSDYPLGIWQYADAMASGKDFPGGGMSPEASAQMICHS
jgi:hypothetical protein